MMMSKRPICIERDLYSEEAHISIESDLYSIDIKISADDDDLFPI